MHTFVMESKLGNFGVGLMVRGEFGDEYCGKFHGLSLHTAIMLTNALNGGTLNSVEKLNVNILEQCLVKGA